MRKVMLREPTHPGVFLKEDYMIPLSLTQARLARLLDVGERTINELCNKKRGISAVMALKLGRLFGIDAEFWLNAQNSYDIWLELQKHKAEIEKVARLEVA
ncbi:MAG: HigA family addiction module antidote protein [Campylobacteraceae bacterium]|nr:HigA family addiction module antidote protein [Campylobacteraceae bacterium]